MIPGQSYLIVAGVALVVGFSGGWKVNSWKFAAEREAEMKGAVKAIELTAHELAKLDIKQVTIKQEVQKHVLKEPVYIDCQHTPDTLRLLNNAIEGRSAEATSDSKLPETGGSWFGRIFRSNDSEAGGSK